MTDTDIRHELTELARDEVDWDGPLPDEPLADHLDSLQLMTLVVAVEDRFEIIITEEDEQAIEDVSDLVEIISEKLHD